MLESVHVLWHVHKMQNGEDCEILIGIYATDADARSAQARVSDKPGFVDYPEGFLIAEHAVGKDGWEEGFITEVC
jgi:homoserine kinase type II